MQNNYIILGYARKWKTGGRAREQLGESKISLVFYQIKDVLSNPTDTAGGWARETLLSLKFMLFTAQMCGYFRGGFQVERRRTQRNKSDTW